MRRNVSTRLSGPALRTRASYQRKFSLLFGNGPATNHGFPHFWRYGAPERIRTSGLCLRRAALYPAELRVLDRPRPPGRSEEHTSELQSLMRSSYAVFCSKKNKTPLIK